MMTHPPTCTLGRSSGSASACRSISRVTGAVSPSPNSKISDQVLDRIALAPSEIDVRYFSRTVAKVQQKGGDRIWNGRCMRSQDLVSSDINAADLKFSGEFGRIADIDLIEQDRIGRRYMVVDAFFVLFEPVFFKPACFPPISDDTNLAVGKLIQKLFRHGVKFDLCDTDLGRPHRPRDK